MNRERNERVQAVIAKLEAARDELSDVVDQARDEVKSIRDEEQEAFDGLSPTAQRGDKGDVMEQFIEMLDEALTSLRPARTNVLEKPIEKLEEVAL